MKNLITLSILALSACNAVQTAQSPPDDTANQVSQPELVTPLIERYNEAWETVFSSTTPLNEVYTVSPRNWSSLDHPEVYSAVLSYEKFGWHRLTLELQEGTASYFINRETMADGEVLMLHKSSSNNPSGLRVSFDFVDDNTAELSFSIQVGLTVYPDRATLLIQ